MLKFDIKKTFNKKTLHFKTKISLMSGVCTIFGDSGSGKTTLLRCLMGLESFEGEVVFQYQEWCTDNKFVKTEKREIGAVFQEPTLFPHLNVKQNLQLAVSKAGKSPFTIDSLAAQLGFDALLEQPTTQLSGGEKQRVAIARALLSNPQLIVMDEPLSSLDETSKNILLPFIKRVSLQIPVIYVTHSVKELFYLSDTMILLNDGQIEAVGDPQKLFLNNNLSISKLAQDGLVLTLWVKDFHEEDKLIEAVVKGEVKEQPLFIAAESASKFKQIQVRIESSDVVIANQPITDSSLLNCLSAQVVDMAQDEQSSSMIITLKIETQFIYARITKRSFNYLKLAVGSKVYAHVKTMAILS